MIMAVVALVVAIVVGPRKAAVNDSPALGGNRDLGLEKSGDSDQYLEGRIKPSDKRYKSMHRALQLLDERDCKFILETGTARDGASNCGGDGCSTVVFGKWAKAHGATMYTVDIDPTAIASSRTANGEWNGMNYIVSDSVAFLEWLPQTIDFLYLDSYDVDWNNIHPSAFHHLKEIQASKTTNFLHKPLS